MTTSRAWFVLVVAALLAAVLVGVSWTRACGAEQQARAATARLEAVQRDVTEVLRLRSRTERVALGERPSHDAIARVGESLTSIGLPTARLKSVTPAADRSQARSDPGHRVQVLRIVLEPVTLAELGAFLDRWRRDHAPWTITGVDLAAASRGRDASEPYTATVTVAALYVADGAQGNRP